MRQPDQRQERAAPAAAKIANVRQRKTPEEIEQLKNNPEAMAKRAARGELNADRRVDPTFVATTAGGRTAARDDMAAQQAGRFAKGGALATALQKARGQKDSLGRINPTFKRTLLARSRNAIRSGGRVNMGTDGRPEAAPLVVANNQNEYVGNILLEMISKYRGYML